MKMAEGNQNPVGEERWEEEAEIGAQLDVSRGGYIFISDHLDTQESFRRRMFGLNHTHQQAVLAITPGTPLFLYDYITSRLHGIFEATSNGGMDIDPSAWPHRTPPPLSRCPAQVIVRRFRARPHLTGEMLRSLIGDNCAAQSNIIHLSTPQLLDILEVFEVNARVCHTISKYGMDKILP